MNNTILAPFFEVATRIICDTKLTLKVEIKQLTSIISMVSWYIGNAKTPDAGSCSDQHYLDEKKFDEDKLSEWIVELNEIYDDYFSEEEEQLDAWDWKEDTAMNEREL